MWVKNKKTGLIWEVKGEVAERLSNSLEYEVIEKSVESEGTEQATNEDEEGSNVIGIDDITKAKISEILRRKGIEHNPKDKKEVLYDLMVGSD